MSEADYCQSCHFLLREYNSCIRPFVFDEGNPLLVSLEIMWALASVLSYLAFIIIVAYCFYQRTYRSFCIATLLGGQHVLCIILKELYVQARPHGACATSYGFPSSHSSFIAALSTWVLIEHFWFHHKSPFKAWKYYATWKHITIPSAVVVPISRFILNYHTGAQIFAGLALGVFCALGYYFVIARPIAHGKDQTFITHIMLKVWQMVGLKDDLSYIDAEPEIQEIKKRK